MLCLREVKMMKKNEYREQVEIDRLRRITGYLVPNIKRWNSGKKAELKDRVKHAGVKEKED